MKITFYGEKGNKKIRAYLVESSLKAKVLLDCGKAPGDFNYSFFPEEIISDIEAIFITHAHLDHWGYLPILIDQNFNKEVYMTGSTYDLLKSYAFKASFKFIEEIDKQNYKKNINKLKKLIKKVKYGEPIKIKQFTVYFLPANHILGSAQIIIEEKSTKSQILYTGDFNPNTSILFNSINIENFKKKYNVNIKPEVVIIECSKVDLKESDFIKEENIFIDMVNKTYGNMGSILVPSKALGDAQEFLIRYFDYCLNKNLKMPIEIFTVGSLLEVNNVYYDHKEELKIPIESISNLNSLSSYFHVPGVN